MRWLIGVGLWVCIASGAWALDPSGGVQVRQLARESASWDGRPISYPQGEAQVTALLIEIAPGAETGWHSHPIPSFAYLLEGTLDLTLDDGRTKQLRAGDTLMEVVGRRHNGRNAGHMPVKIVVFYTGAVGTPLSIKQEK